MCQCIWWIYLAGFEAKHFKQEYIFTKILCPKILLELAIIDKGSRHHSIYVGTYIQYRKRLQYS